MSDTEILDQIKSKKKKKTVVIVVVVAVVLIALIAFVVSAVKKSIEAMSAIGSTASTEEVSTRDLIKSVGATGTVVSLESRDLTGELSGVTISALNVKVGDEVKAGDLLVTFDSEDIEEKLQEARDNLDLSEKKNALTMASSSAGVKDAKRSMDYQIVTAQESLTAAEENVAKEQETYDSLCGTYNGKQNDTNKAWDLYLKAVAVREEAQKALDEAGEQAENYEELKAALEAAMQAEANAKAAHDAAKAISDAAADAANAQFYVLKSAKKTFSDQQRSYEQTVANAQSSYNSALNSQAQTSLSLTTDAQEKQIEDYEEQLDLVNLYAPISGVVTACNFRQGEKYAQGPILTVQDTSDYKIKAFVSEYDISDIRVGQRVLIKTNATGNEEMEGEVLFVSPTASKDQTSIKYEVQIGFKEKQERLRLDMSASLSIIVDEHMGALTVPYTAVQTAEDGSTFVEVHQADGSFKVVPVQILMESSYYTEVAGEGLKEGDKVKVIESSGELDMNELLYF
ncbi:MAG: efflux RND transporter periplasmic adaptor subunit [Lachnospiraceae bacterium]|nr:efflux RND transporter periplasmic adaptor subunit [Lachnospiraceae bacterium]